MLSCMLTKVAPPAADGSVTESAINSEVNGGTVNTPSGTGTPVTNSGGPLEPEILLERVRGGLSCSYTQCRLPRTRPVPARCLKLCQPSAVRC